MQNKPNSQNPKVNPNLFPKKVYEYYHLPGIEKTNPIQTQFAQQAEGRQIPSTLCPYVPLPLCTFFPIMQNKPNFIPWGTNSQTRPCCKSAEAGRPNLAIANTLYEPHPPML